MVPGADLFLAGEAAAFLPGADFLPFSTAFLPGVNLRTLSTVFAFTAALGAATTFLAEAFEAAFEPRLAAAPPLTLAAAAEPTETTGFLAPAPRIATAVLPSLKFQSSLPDTIPYETSPFPKSGTSVAGNFARDS